MADIKLTDLCAEHNWDRKKVDDLRRKLGIGRKKRGNAWVIEDHEAAVLVREMELPDEMQSETYWATGLHEANNPNFVFCTIEGVEYKQPVLIPRRYIGKLVKKRFPVEKIEDKTGVSWRHEWFRKLNGYTG